MKHFLLITFFLVQNAWSQKFDFDQTTGKAIPNYIGEVKLFRGKVFKKTGQSTEPVTLGTRLAKNDSIFTEEKSFVKILIVDDTTVTLSSDSELNFADFKFTDKENRQIVYSFIKGQIRAAVKNKAEEGDLTVKTKAAIMGIRGTEFLVNHQSLNNKEISEFALLSGQVDIKDMGNKKYPLSKGEHLVVMMDQVKKDTDHKRGPLPPELILELEHEESFLNYYKVSPSQHGQSTQGQAEKNAANSAAEKSSVSTTEEGEGLQNKLQRLNEELKKNQKPKF